MHDEWYCQKANKSWQGLLYQQECSIWGNAKVITTCSHCMSNVLARKHFLHYIFNNAYHGMNRVAWNSHRCEQLPNQSINPPLHSNGGDQLFFVYRFGAISIGKLTLRILPGLFLLVQSPTPQVSNVQISLPPPAGGSSRS